MKLRLTVVTGSLAGAQRELEGGSIVLGRSAACGLAFDKAQEHVVSGRHAEVRQDPDGWYVEDRGSTNGTLLNGKQVTRERLSPGDVIQLATGGPQVHVDIVAESADGAGRTVTLGEGAPPRPALAVPPPPGAAAPRATPAPAAAAPPSRTQGRLATMTFYDPEKDKSPTGVDQTPGIVGSLVGLALLSVMGLAILLLMMLEMGIGGAVMGTLMAFLPAPFYLLVFLWLDRFDPEPGWALAAAFAWGASFALLTSYVANTAFGVATAIVAGAPAGDALSTIVSAPIVEELTKGLGVILIMVFLRSEFDGVLDGIIYAGIIALGFATVENVFYYGRKFLEDGASGMLLLAFLRGGLAPFSHSLFTSMTGIGCGISRESHRLPVRILMPLAGLFAAMSLHGLWNLIASALGGLFFLFYLVVWVPLFLIVMVVVAVMAARERRIVRKMLQIEVTKGALSQEHLLLSGSLFRRASWIVSSLGSPARLRARRRYLRLLTKLAFCYWHVERAAVAGNETISLPKIPVLHAELRALRPKVA